MLSPSFQALLASLTAWLIWRLYVSTKSDLENIPGPKRTSFFGGETTVLRRPYVTGADHLPRIQAT
jgi:hypothetical protein